MRRKLGCFNLHGSLLPRWRGAAPINRAIMAGDAESGVMVMKMDVGLDTGDVAMAERLKITDTMTAADLHDALAPLGADLMVRAMGALERGGLQLSKQSEDGVTYAAKIDKAEARIDWTRPAREVLRHIHGLSPFPGAWCELATDGEPARIKILRCEPAKGSGAPGEVLDDRLTIACGDGAIRILELQRAGKAPMKAADFLRGTPLSKPPATAQARCPATKLIIEYDGTPFSGWQIQDNGPTVQGALEDAVKAICGEQVRVHGSGRTDAGVHALAQVAHCDIRKAVSAGAPARRAERASAAASDRRALGGNRAPMISRRASLRGSAITATASPTTAPTSRSISSEAGACRGHLDTDAMDAAAKRLLGKHDFTTFRDTECQAKSPEKTLDQLDVVREGDEVSILTSARSFLHSQVRSMVGSLVWVGEGRWSADDLAAALAARNRAACGPVAPPEGLYLVRVDY